MVRFVPELAVVGEVAEGAGVVAFEDVEVVLVVDGVVDPLLEVEEGLEVGVDPDFELDLGVVVDGLDLVVSGDVVV